MGNIIKSSTVFLIVIVNLVVVPFQVFAANDFVPELQPSPNYLPEEVVGIQMRALANNDQPFSDAGIELTFRFAAPGNKAITGPLSRFARLFATPAYQPMLNHQMLEIGDAKIDLDTATVPVVIESSDGSRAGYLFVLGKQAAEPFVNCWMTNSVVPVRLTDPVGKTFL